MVFFTDDHLALRVLIKIIGCLMHDHHRSYDEIRTPIDKPDWYIQLSADFKTIF
jgi:hypothetical protein